MKIERPLHICSLQTSLNPESHYGGGIFHLHCLEALADAGIPCLISLAFHPEHARRENWEVRALPIRRTYKLGALLSNLVYLLHLIWLYAVRKERFDLLRVGDPYYAGIAAWLFSRVVSVPTVGVLFHVDDEHPWRDRITAFVSRKLDAIITTSRFSKRQICEKFRLEPDRVFVTYGGVTRFESNKSREEAKASLGLSGKTVAVFLGTLIPRKNPDGLLAMFAEASRGLDDAMLLVCGAQPDSSSMMFRLQELAGRLGIADRVIFTGSIDNNKKADIYRAADLFVFPSKMEGFGLAVVEAMAEGVPAVVSDAGSLPELIRDGETGFIRPLSGSGFADAIRTLLTDGNFRNRLGQAAKADVESRFTWKSCAEQTIDAFQKIVAPTQSIRLGVLLNTGDSFETMEREGQKDRFSQQYLARWRKLVDEVVVFSYGQKNVTDVEGVRVVANPGVRKGLLYALFSPLMLYREFRRISLFRVMQTQGVLPALLARWLYRRPFVTTYGYLYGDSMRLKGRYTYGLWLDFLERAALPFAEAVIVTTPSLRRHVSKFVASDRIQMIPNGVDTKLFVPALEKKEDDVFRVLFVGRLEPHKNVETVLQALAPINARKVRFIVVGDGSDKARLEELASRFGLDARFTGSVPHGELPGFYASADLFVLPSRFEGHPKALIEAMACGVPCLGADAPGIVDVIENGKNGMLAEPTVADFAAQIVRLMDAPSLREQLGAAAREFAVEHYDLETLLAREMALLKRNLEKRNGNK